MSIEETKIDLSGLFPDFNSFGIYPETAEQLSAFFVVVLFCVAGLFFVISLYALWKAFSRINGISRFCKDLEKEIPKTRMMSRQGVRGKANKAKGDDGHLWREFDDNLVEIKEGDEIHLYTVYDASHFFNSSTLAREITESRMLAAVPGFLTALGVIGTFVGLQLGLSELNIGNDVAVDEMKSGLAHVIGGAKIAFMTSVWGVSLSVLFNVIEKGLENWVRYRIHYLQMRIDALFPCFSAEVQLKKIAEDGSESREALQGLAERIGEKMQEALIEATTGITTGLEQSLEKIMAPAINKLVDETNDGSQKALEQLVERFLEKFGEQGEAQRGAMDEASKGVGEALSTMNQTLEGFVGTLNQNQDTAVKREQELMENISQRTNELVEQNSKHGELLIRVTKHLFSKGNKAQEEAQQHQAQRETQLGKQFESVVSEMSESMNRTLEGFVDTLNQNQDTAVKREQELMENISQRTNELVEQNSKHGDLLIRVTKHLFAKGNKAQDEARQAQEQREVALGEQLENVVGGMAASIDKQSSVLSSLIAQGKDLQQRVEQGQADLESLTSGVKAGAMELRTAADRVKQYGEMVSVSSRQLGGVIQDAAKSTAELAGENQKSSTEIVRIQQRFSEDIKVLDGVGKTLNEMIQTADSTFTHLEQHQRRYLADLQKNVEALAEQGAKLLSDYAVQANAQTQDHLGVWAQHTTTYAEQMSGVARALSSVVEDIEDKLNA